MIRELAPAKVNLVLHVGPRRGDGLHELCSLFASLELADELTFEPAERDEVVCQGVERPNLVTAAIDAFRAAASDAELPPLRVTIEKRIPVAAGLGGGSADAAAALRAANRLTGAPFDARGLRGIGERIGADVASQVEPRHWLVTGAGERLEPVELPAMALVLVPAAEGLATAAVYTEADRLEATRAALDAGALRRIASLPLPELAAAMENDLERSALALADGAVDRAVFPRQGRCLLLRFRSELPARTRPGPPRASSRSPSDAGIPI